MYKVESHFMVLNIFKVLNRVSTIVIVLKSLRYFLKSNTLKVMEWKYICRVIFYVKIPYASY